jgi:S-adenosylmethionine synthetase
MAHKVVCGSVDKDAGLGGGKVPFAYRGALERHAGGALRLSCALSLDGSYLDGIDDL